MSVSPSHYADLVIIGAGYAGLSAVTSAVSCLSPSNSITIIDKRFQYGGQWLDQYDFLRLHQPFQFFTAYDQPWKLQKPHTHLASRNEVINHLHDLGERVEQRDVNIKTLFGHTYVRFDTMQSTSDLILTVQRNGDEESTFTIRTPRMIKATGFDIEIKKPFPITATTVTSIAPTDLSSVAYNPTAKFVILGSGKTAMDAILYLQNIHPNVQIVLIAGEGVSFINRDRFLPANPIACIFGGRLIPSSMVDYALEWNGTNHVELMQKLVDCGDLLSVVPEPKSCQMGLLGEGEAERVRNAVDGRIIKGRMEDIVDDSGTPSIRMKDGRMIPISKDGSGNIFVVNCTSHFKEAPAVPLLQAQGRVLNPQFPLGFSGRSAALLTHAWFLNKMDDIAPRLLKLEVSRSDSTDRFRGFFEFCLFVVYNIGIVSQVLPQRIMARDRSDTSAWYPWHRRLMMVMKINGNMSLLKNHAEKIFGQYGFPIEHDVSVAH